MTTLFSEGFLGPVKLRNRTIRAAAFEGMSAGNGVTQELIDYHTAVAKGGVGLTTVAYAAVSKSGISFPHQLWIREEIIPDLKRLTDSIHSEGAKASIQLGHCGNMADKSVTGMKPYAPSGGINWYGPTFPKTMTKPEIETVVEDFKSAVLLARKAGFDAVEIHAGHGYLISQFLSPYTNKRKDEFGGSFENRSRFLRMVLSGIHEILPDDMAFIVKMNASDGFSGGITFDEALKVAKIAEECGVHGLVVSGGFVSKAPMFVLRGAMPIDIMAYFMKDPIKKFFVKLFGDKLIKTVPFEEGYFMESAKKIQDHVTVPVILVGGMNSKLIIEKAFAQGFEWIAIARALIHNTHYVNDLRDDIIEKSGCTICNYCIAKMYSGTMACHFNQQDIPTDLQPKIEQL
jgi:2,4-dienoyl-CoA reductase-like NADH-dependent reductase (Old Yellow Enzyme family)